MFFFVFVALLVCFFPQLTSKQCQVMDISDEDDAGPWAPGEKKAKWEDHRFGLSKLDVFD